MPEVISDLGATWLAEKVKDNHDAGELFHAIGIGDPDWDLETQPPDPAASSTGLYAEIHRQVPDNVFFCEDVEGTATDGTTDSIEDTSRVEASGTFDGLLLKVLSGASVGVEAVIDSWDLPTFTFLFPTSSFPDGVGANDEYIIYNAQASSPTGVLKVQTTWDAADTFADGEIREEGVFIVAAGYSFDIPGDFIGSIVAGADTAVLAGAFYALVSVGDILHFETVAGTKEYRRIKSKDGSDQVTLEAELTYGYSATAGDTVVRETVTQGLLLNHYRDTKFEKTDSIGMLREIILDFRES